MRDYTKIEAWKLADNLTVAIYERTRDAISELARTGTIAGGPGLELLPEITDLLGAPEILEVSKKYEV